MYFIEITGLQQLAANFFQRLGLRNTFESFKVGSQNFLPQVRGFVNSYQRHKFLDTMLYLVFTK